MVGIVSAVFNVAVCIGVPLGAFLVLLRRRSGWRVFLLGMAGFFVSQLCVRQPLLALLGQVDAYRLFAAGNPVGQLLFLSVTAGLAEESARLVIFRLLARRGRVQHGTPVWYGLGHGGLEAALVGVNSMVLLVIFPELLQRAGWAVALSYAAMAAALFTFTQKVYPIRYEYKKLAAMALVCAATAALSKFSGQWGEVTVLCVKVVLLTLYPLWMWLILREKKPAASPVLP